MPFPTDSRCSCDWIRGKADPYKPHFVGCCLKSISILKNFWAASGDHQYSMRRLKSPHSYACTMRHPTRTLTLHRWRRKVAQIEPSLFSYNSLCAKRLRCISFRFSRVSRMGFTSRSFVRVGNRKTSRMYKYWPQTFLNCLYVCDCPFPSPYLYLFWFILSKTMLQDVEFFQKLL